MLKQRRRRRGVGVVLVSAVGLTACGLSVKGGSSRSSSTVVDAGPGEPFDAGPPLPIRDAARGDGGDGAVAPPCRSLSFQSASKSYVEMPDAPELEPGGPMTIEAWIRRTDAAQEMHIASHADDINLLGWALLVDTGSLEFRLYDGTTELKAGEGAVPHVPVGRWVHVAGTWDGSDMRSFVDGALVSATPKRTPIADFAGPARIGIAAYARDFPFDGEIDEVRLTRGAIYTKSFQPEYPLPTNESAIFHYRFDEAAGQARDEVNDASAATLKSDDDASTSPRRVGECPR